MIWVMIIISVRLFLRSDEVINIKFMDFVPELFVYDPVGNLEALAIKIKGKTDTVVYTLLLWKDEKYPELCPVTALLVYIQMAQLEASNIHLFPNKTTLMGAKSNEIIKCHKSENCETCHPRPLLEQVQLQEAGEGDDGTDELIDYDEDPTPPNTQDENHLTEQQRSVISYASFHNTVKKLFTKFLKRLDALFGSHTLRFFFIDFFNFY